MSQVLHEAVYECLEVEGSEGRCVQKQHLQKKGTGNCKHPKSTRVQGIKPVIVQLEETMDLSVL